MRLLHKILFQTNFFLFCKKKLQKEANNLRQVDRLCVWALLCESPVKLRFRFKNRLAPFTRFFGSFVPIREFSFREGAQTKPQISPLSYFAPKRYGVCKRKTSPFMQKKRATPTGSCLLIKVLFVPKQCKTARLI